MVGGASWPRRTTRRAERRRTSWLDDLSVNELGERIALLRTEVARLEAASHSKQRALNDASSVFRRAASET